MAKETLELDEVAENYAEHLTTDEMTIFIIALVEERMLYESKPVNFLRNIIEEMKDLLEDYLRKIMTLPKHLKFAHISDVHLDFLQYGIEQRREDFNKAWRFAVEECIIEHVNFVILGGDLFHHRQSRHVALDHAILGLQQLKDEKIPVFAVIGNHEIKQYRDNLSAPELLRNEGYLHLVENSPEHYAMYAGAVMWGLNWRGTKTSDEVRRFCSYIKRTYEQRPHLQEYQFHMLIVHGSFKEESGEFVKDAFSIDDLAEAKDIIDYVALGHQHNNYIHQIEDGPVVVNPGSLETNSFTEAQWPDRGLVIAEIEDHELNLRQVPTPKRDFISLNLDVSPCTNNREIGELILENMPPLEKLPVFRIVLTGTIGFDVDRFYLESLLDLDLALNNSFIKDKTLSNDWEYPVKHNGYLGQDLVEEDAITTALPDFSPDHVRRILELANNRVPTEIIIKEL